MGHRCLLGGDGRQPSGTRIVIQSESDRRLHGGRRQRPIDDGEQEGLCRLALIVIDCPTPEPTKQLGVAQSIALVVAVRSAAVPSGRHVTSARTV